jgi:hypothetical protein
MVGLEAGKVGLKVNLEKIKGGLILKLWLPLCF